MCSVGGVESLGLWGILAKRSFGVIVCSMLEADLRFVRRNRPVMAVMESFP